MDKKQPVFFQPEQWGRHFWYTVECTIFSMDNNYESSKEFVYLFFYALQNTLPCPECREHYQNYFQKNDLKSLLDSKEKVFHWVYNLRKDINTRLGVKNISFSDYQKELEKKFHLKL